MLLFLLSLCLVSQTDPPDLTGVPAEYCDLCAVFSKSRATSLTARVGYIPFPVLKERPWTGTYGSHYRLGSFAIPSLPPVQGFSSFRKKTAPYALVLITEG